MMNRYYLSLTFLLLSVTILYSQASLPQNKQTIDQYQKRLLDALIKERVNDYIELVPSKKDLSVVFTENLMVKKLSKQYPGVNPATIRKNVNAIVNDDAFSEELLKSERESFVRALQYGKQIGIDWKTATFKGCTMDSVNSSDSITYEGKLFFMSKNKSYIIQHECVRYAHTFLIGELRIPYPDPAASFAENMDDFFFQINKNKQFTFSDAHFFREARDTSLLRKDYLVLFKEKMIIHRGDQEEFYVSYFKYKTKEQAKKLFDTLISGRVKEKAVYTAKILLKNNEIILFRVRCQSSKDVANELENKLIEIFVPGQTMSNNCMK